MFKSQLQWTYRSEWRNSQSWVGVSCPVPQLKIRHCTCTVRWSAWLYTWLFRFRFRSKCLLSLMAKSYMFSILLAYYDWGILTRDYCLNLAGIEAKDYFPHTLLDLWMIRDCCRNIFCPRHKKTPNVITYSNAVSLLAYRHWVALDVPVKTSVNRTKLDYRRLLAK